MSAPLRGRQALSPRPCGPRAHSATWPHSGEVSCPEHRPHTSVSRVLLGGEQGFSASFTLTEGFLPVTPAPQQTPIPSLPQPLGLPLAGPEGP